MCLYFLDGLFWVFPVVEGLGCCAGLYFLQYLDVVGAG